MRFVPFSLLCLFLNSFYGFSQEIRVSGIVLNEVTGEPVGNVHISESHIRREILSDSSGKFSMICPKDTLSFVFKKTLLKTVRISFLAQKDTFIEISLPPFSLEGIEIIGEKTVVENGINKLSVPVERLTRLPSFLGESDPLKAISLFPGIQTALEGSGALVIRGGFPGQNMILFDETPLYNPYHLVGITSAFNTDVLGKLDVYKGMFPVRYGNRIASVLDIKTKPPTSVKNEKSITLGLLSSRFYIGETSQTGKVSWLLGGRISYLNLVSLPLFLSYKNGRSDEHFSYWLYDLNGKIMYSTTKAGQFSLSAYLGQDYFTTRYGEFGKSENVNHLQWGNIGISLVHDWKSQNKWEVKNALTFTRYKYYRKVHDYEEITGGTENFSFHDRSVFALQDWGIKSEILRSFRPGFRVLGGVEGRVLFFAARQGSAEGNENDLSFAELFRYKSFMASGWLESEVEAGRWLINPGVRSVSYNYSDKTFLSVEPRLQVSFKTGLNTRLTASSGKVSQNLHLISSSLLGLPNDIWIPASPKYPIQTGFQHSLGFEWKKEQHPLGLQIEAYFRNSRNNILYLPSYLDLDYFPDPASENAFIPNGRANAWGMEFLLTFNNRRVNGWLSYTLSKSEQSFPGFLDGQKIPSLFDQRHILNLVTEIPISPRWSFSSTWILQSGRPVFLPSSRYTGLAGGTIWVYPLEPVRMPVYHRMDIGFTYTNKADKSNPETLKFGVYNVYNQKNPVFLQVERPRIQNSSGSQVLIPGKITGQTLLPFLPYISYQWKF